MQSAAAMTEPESTMNCSVVSSLKITSGRFAGSPRLSSYFFSSSGYEPCASTLTFTLSWLAL